MTLQFEVWKKISARDEFDYMQVINDFERILQGNLVQGNVFLSFLGRELKRLQASIGIICSQLLRFGAARVLIRGFPS